MCAAQVEWFKTRLQRDRDVAINALTGLRRDLEDLVPESDVSDVASNVEANDLSARHAERLKNELGQIDDALKRIQDGEYGYCVDTGDEIGLPRLVAAPTARRTIDAQEAQERRLRHS